MKAAVFYVLAAFGLGFVLGPIRELLLAPMLGRLLAVLLELPLMLAFCWWIAPRITTHCRVPPGAWRLRMGITALALLLALEFLAGIALRGRGLQEWAADFATWPGLVTLLAYLVFALLPLRAGKPGAGDGAPRTT